jgi:hypothetical protein
MFLFPASVFLCFRQLRDEHVFVIIYAVRVYSHSCHYHCVICGALDTHIDPAEPEIPEEAKAAAETEMAPTESS